MKNIVITGSARGIGYEMAREFLRHGMNVTISSVNPASLARAAENLSAFKASVLAVACDVRNKEDIKKLWSESSTHWGSVDIWINNAGVSQPRRNIWELADETTDALIQTNILGVIYGSQIASEGMMKQEGGGFIYNMEGLGSDGRVIKGTGLYAMTKWNLVYFTKALAHELRGTPVNAGRLMPGMMPTDFITKPAVGENTRIVDQATRRIFNILGDRPDVVARFLVGKILSNNRNNARISWLTAGKVMRRFLIAPFRKRDLFSQ